MFENTIVFGGHPVYELSAKEYKTGVYVKAKTTGGALCSRINLNNWITTESAFNASPRNAFEKFIREIAEKLDGVKLN